MRNFILLSSLSFLAVACGQREQSPYYGLDRSQQTSPTASAEEHFPADRAVDVSTEAEVSIDFSERIDFGSVNFFNFRVEDEMGRVVPGEIRISGDDRTLTFIPKSAGERSVFQANTTFTVLSRYLKNVSGNLVPPFGFQFRTEEDPNATGAFRAIKALPEEEYITPDTLTIAVEFNETIKLPPSGGKCNRDYYGNSIQIGILQPLNDQGESGFVPVEANSICAEGKRLEFKLSSSNPLPAALVPQYLQVRVFETPELVGNISLQSLDRQAIFDKVIVPTPQQILQLLFGDDWPPNQE